VPAKNALLSPAGTLTAPAGAEEGPVRRDALPHTMTGGDDGAPDPDAGSVLSREGSANPTTARPAASSVTAAA